MAKRTIKINIKLPEGVIATKELTATATEAAENAIASTVDELARAQEVANDLASKGYNITAEEILNRKSASSASTGRTAKKATKKGAKKGAKKAAKKGGKKGAKKANKGSGKRVVLSPEQREELTNDLREGAKVSEITAKYGVSPATVMNIKKSAGLTKRRGA